MNRTIHWGIMGCGSIAAKFATGLQLVADAKLVAVGSRDYNKACEFSNRFAAEKAYGSYAELANDPLIDVIYIATPHVFHCENTLLCLEHNKAVLCEKPFAINGKEVQQMIAKAQEKKLFLMEGLWTRFFPIIEKTLDLISTGRIGEIKYMTSDFGFNADKNPNNRLYNPNLGGGSLLDIGIYPIFLSLLYMGIPNEINASAVLTNANIDESLSLTFKYGEAKIAQLFSTFAVDTSIETNIYGTLGRIRIHRKWFMPTAITITNNQDEAETITIECPGDGYHYEASEVTRCIREGLTEHPKLNHQFSLNLIRIMDTIRQQCGIRYKNDN